jgi:hypothetical protein
LSTTILPSSSLKTPISAPYYSSSILALKSIF